MPTTDINNFFFKVDSDRIRKQLQARLKDEELQKLQHAETISKLERELKVLREKAKMTDDLADDLKKIRERRTKVYISALFLFLIYLYFL